MAHTHRLVYLLNPLKCPIHHLHMEWPRSMLLISAANWLSTPTPGTWKAHLPFECIVGYNNDALQTVNLFDYVGTSSGSRMIPSEKFEIRFDTSKYPSTDKGLALLIKELKTVALNYGTQLISGRKGKLICFRGSKGGDRNKKRKQAETVLVDANGIKE